MNRVLFYRHKDPQTGYLSNFSECGIHYAGIDWTSSEQLYQARKFAEDSPLFLTIAGTASAREAKDTAVANSDHYRSDWQHVKVLVMYEVIWAKFVQNADLHDRLLATGNATLIEASPKDNFWGWGDDEQGANVLGQLLMILRASLRGQFIG